MRADPEAALSNPRSVVVIGAGLAGARTVDALRTAGFDGEITLLGAEGLAPYDRPPLSKQLFERQAPVWLTEDLSLDLTSTTHLARPATGLIIDHDTVTVTTGDGPVSADAAVIATGAAPTRPPEWDAQTLHTAADAAALRSALMPGEQSALIRGRRLVIIGAGWIGAEVAGVAADAGAHVTAVEAVAPLAAAVGTQVGRLTEPWYAAAGVRLVLGDRVAEVAADRVTLASGTVLETDVVLAAVGVRPATDWLAGVLPLGPGGAIEVDAGMRVPGTGGRVLAVGDVASRASVRHGRVPGGHWDGALRTPEIAAASLLGTHGPDGPADPAPYVWSDQLGHHLSMYGLPRPEDDVVLRGGTADPAGDFTAVWFRPGSDTVDAVLAADRPKDVSAARKLFTGPHLPRLDRVAIADGAPLRTR